MNNTLKNLTITNLETVKDSLSSIDEMYELLTEGMKIPANKLTELMKAKTALETAAIHLTNFIKVAAVIAVEKQVDSVMDFTGKIDMKDWMDDKQEREIIIHLIDASDLGAAPGGRLRKEPLKGTEEIYKKVCELLLVGPDSIIAFEYDYATHMRTGITIYSPDTDRKTVVVGILMHDLYFILCGKVPEA